MPSDPPRRKRSVHEEVAEEVPRGDDTVPGFELLSTSFHEVHNTCERTVAIDKLMQVSFAWSPFSQAPDIQGKICTYLS